MPEETTKQGPAGIPPAAVELADRLGPAGVLPADPFGVWIRLKVVGGHADERYEFRFEADGLGEVTTSLVDRIRKVEKDVRFAKMAQSDVARILKSLDIRRMAPAARAAKPIPPGSVVGRLTVGDGREEIGVVFMADRGQAKGAGVRLDPAVEEAVEQIYRVAASQLKVKDVRP